MALETVSVSVIDDQVVPEAVDGVSVRIFDSSGTTLITEGTTGSVLTGSVDLTLDGSLGGTDYQVRFYLNGGAIPSPQYIRVYSPAIAGPLPSTNSFQAVAAMLGQPTATNPRLCRASGYIWGPDGRPKRGIDVALIPCFRPLVVDNIGVLGERVNCKTDKNGYIQVDLIRSGYYQATVESHENVTRMVAVPDRSSINIMHLLFPVVVSASLGVSSIALAEGSSRTFSPVITSSDYRVLSGAAPEDVQYSVDDPSIASVTVDLNSLVLNGISPGTTSLRITRRDSSIVYIPDPGINGSISPITVS